MRFGLLGPVEVWRGGQSLDIGPPKRRALLTRLLEESGRSVSAERLRHDLWPQAKGNPGSLSSVHAHISRLRSALESGRGEGEAGRLLVRTTAGYVLTAPRDSFDSTRFATGLRHARQAEGAGSTTSARQTVEDALALWRGSALQDAVRYPFAVAEARRLDGLRHQAEELRAHLLLADGEPETAALAAEALVEAAPLREASWAILMRALYASGRAAEALRQYECFRIALAEDLGVDPGPGLRELHLAILRHDADALHLPRTRTVPSAATSAAPGAGTELLPLVGRTAQSDRVATLMREPRETRDGPAEPCCQGKPAVAGADSWRKPPPGLAAPASGPPACTAAGRWTTFRAAATDPRSGCSPN
ncbi:BTAD domain-containing putative transcriptional regulator [Streptomyces sp. NPDC019396]|uniref:AfsR/SARP family transcriptional regulator n=1 Tax=Streptomyces sp. NPDC019396 TaxID=3154687 RepID=UPI00340C0962